MRKIICFMLILLALGFTCVIAQDKKAVAKKTFSINPFAKPTLTPTYIPTRVVHKKEKSAFADLDVKATAEANWDIEGFVARYNALTYTAVKLYKNSDGYSLCEKIAPADDNSYVVNVIGSHSLLVGEIMMV